MEQDVFISYSRKDSEMADCLCEAMDEAGITYFVDWDDYWHIITRKELLLVSFYKMFIKYWSCNENNKNILGII